MATKKKVVKKAAPKSAPKKAKPAPARKAAKTKKIAPPSPLNGKNPVGVTPPEAPKFNLLQFRAEGLVEHDATVIEGIDTEQTVIALWDEKVNLEPVLYPEDKPDAVTAKDVVRRMLGSDYAQAFVVSKTTPFLRTQLDAFSPRYGSFVRIFVVDAAMHDAFAKFLASGQQFFEGFQEVDLLAMTAQVRHQMLVTGLRKARFFVVTESSAKVLEMTVEYDHVWESNYVAKCIQFWDFVVRGERPPLDGETIADVVAPGAPARPKFHGEIRRLMSIAQGALARGDSASEATILSQVLSNIGSYLKAPQASEGKTV